MRSRLAHLAYLLLGVPAFAQEPSGPPEDLLKRRAVYSVPGMDQVRVRRDLAYRKDAPALKMDLYLPRDAAVIARAGRDDPALNASVDAFVTAALASGVTLELLNHAAGRHAFDILDDDDRSRAVIRRTVAFLRESLAVNERP